jgi:hypothetical protein
MKLTVIVDDKSVYENGVSYSGLNLSLVPAGIHALQWDSDASFGCIEFSEIPNTPKQQNQEITELPSWAVDCMNEWTNADNAAKQLAVEMAAAAEAAKLADTSTTTKV